MEASSLSTEQSTVAASAAWYEPLVERDLVPDWILRAGGIALTGALLGASYPAWLASRKDPVEALSYD